MITDVLVIKQYHRDGEMGHFRLALGFMVFTAFLHALTAFVNLHRKQLSESVPRVVASLCLLSPLLDGYSVWSGREQDADEIFPPLMMLAATRSIELLFESLPESILQVAIFVKTENPTSLQKFSILSSIVASAFTMADTNVTTEQSAMNSQRRGPYTHTLYGLVRNSTQGLLAIYSSMFLFLGGYLSLGVLALASVIVAHWPLFFVWWVLEQGLWRFAVTRAHGKYLTGSQQIITGHAYVIWFMGGCQGIMSFVPWQQLRHPSVTGGGKVFAGWIVYRGTLNLLMCLISGSMMLDRKDVLVSSTAYSSMVTTAAACTVLGAIATYYACTPLRRKTLYSTQTGYDCHNDEFNGPTLYHEHLNLDGQRAYLIMNINPHFYSIDSVYNWVSTMQADNVLFEDPALLPKAVGPKVTLERFFEYIALVFQKHGTKDHQDAIKAKLTELKEQVAAKHIT